MYLAAKRLKPCNVGSKFQCSDVEAAAPASGRPAVSPEAAAQWFQRDPRRLRLHLRRAPLFSQCGAVIPGATPHAGGDDAVKVRGAFGEGLIPDPLALLHGHFVAPESVLVVRGEAVHHDGNRKGQDEDAL